MSEVIAHLSNKLLCVVCVFVWVCARVWCVRVFVYVCAVRVCVCVRARVPYVCAIPLF